jgi:hypothetical protein
MYFILVFLLCLLSPLVLMLTYITTNTAFRYLSNLAGTDYELPQDDAVVSKHVGAL